MAVRGKTLTNARIYHVKRAKLYEKSLMFVKIVYVHNSWIVKFELWISNLRNCWQLLVTIWLAQDCVWMFEAYVSGRLFQAWQWEVRLRPMPKSTIYEKKSHDCESSWYAWWVVKFELWISNLRNCWRLLITIGLCKIVSGGHMVSGYLCYVGKHKL